jgi:hypothetical protein
MDSGDLPYEWGEVPMTGSEIKLLAESYVDDEIEDSTALMWLNEWLYQFADDAEVYSDTTMTASNTTTFYALPSDFSDIAAITVDGADYGGYYTIFNGKIRFASAGIFAITYKAIPAVLTAMSGTPAVHPLLTQTGALWLAMRFKQMDDDENQDANRLRFEFDKQKAFQLTNIRRKSNPSVIPMVFGI